MGNVLSVDSDDSDYPDLDEQRTLSAQRAATELQSVARLKQGSLGISFCDRNHVHLSVAFKVDAPVPCRVSSFTLASENSETGEITTETDAVPGLPVFYSAGLDQAFPYSTTDKSLHHIVDVKRLSTRYLRRSGATFPLIIRIESLSSTYSSGLYSKFDIRSLRHGGALPPGVNAHTVFAKFRFRPDGCWEIRVIHQKLWVNGIGYDMPSVGPITIKKNTPPPPVAATDFSPKAAIPAAAAIAPSAAAAAAAAAATDYPAIFGPRAPAPVSSTSKCMICQANRVQVMSTPCNHASMCIPCAQKRQQQMPTTNFCPVCYKPTQNLIVLGQATSPRGKAGAAA